MKIEKFGVYLADLKPSFGTEPGKSRPVVVVQTDLLNGIHPSTIVCPMTSRVVRGLETLRVHVAEKESGLTQASDILVDQIRAIDNRRFRRRLGRLSESSRMKLTENLHILVLE